MYFDEENPMEQTFKPWIQWSLAAVELAGIGAAVLFILYVVRGCSGGVS